MTSVDTVTVGHALDVNYFNLALGHDVDERAAATFVRNRGLPRIYDANFAFAIRAAGREAIQMLLSDARTHFAHAERLTFRCDSRTQRIFLPRMMSGPAHATLRVTRTSQDVSQEE